MRSHRYWNLLLLGLIGMTLSEAFSWNARVLQATFERGPFSVILLTLTSWLVYTIMFALLADTIHRHKVSDFTGLLLLGFIYGMVNEGIIAELLYLPIPPRFLGISVLLLATICGWHAWLDVGFGFWIFRGLRNGKINLSESRITLREAKLIAAVALFWFPWQYAAWQQRWHPGGMSLHLQMFFLLVPQLLLFVVITRALRNPVNPFKDGVLTSRERHISWFVITLFAINRIRILQPGHSFIGWLVFIMFFCFLFRISRTAGNSEVTCDEQACEFSRKKYILGSLLMVSYYVLFQMTTIHFNLAPIWKRLSILAMALIMIASLSFWIETLWVSLTKKKK